MGFIATEVLDVLDYDFRPHVDAQGTTPEPSNAKIRDFQRAVKKATSEVVVEQFERQERADGPTLADIQKALSDENDDEAMAILDEVIVAVAGVCSGSPSLAEITSLPFRLQQHFIGYIMGKFFSGEASTSATTPPPAGVRLVSSGI